MPVLNESMSWFLIELSLKKPNLSDFHYLSRKHLIKSKMIKIKVNRSLLPEKVVCTIIVIWLSAMPLLLNKDDNALKTKICKNAFLQGKLLKPRKLKLKKKLHKDEEFLLV